MPGTLYSALILTHQSTTKPATYGMSYEQMMHWIATTDAELTFVGPPINPLAPRSAQNTVVTYCTNRVGSICGGTCRVHTSGATCFDAAGTNCMAATNNVGFCSGASCTGDCEQLYPCDVSMDDGFCYTPGVRSILVSGA